MPSRRKIPFCQLIEVQPNTEPEQNFIWFNDCLTNEILVQNEGKATVQIHFDGIYSEQPLAPGEQFATEVNTDWIAFTSDKATKVRVWATLLSNKHGLID